MRPTGRLHLGHYHGVIKNWVKQQHEYECYFFAADWHALTTGYENSANIASATHDMIVDWLAAGINPGSATLFIQSRIPELAELHLLLSMITPQAWLERLPSYKDALQAQKEHDHVSYGLLGNPVLQSADILAFRAGVVPVGGDQEAHVELCRDISRRFNHLYGREADFEANAEQAIRKLGKKTAKLYRQLRTAYTSHGDAEALATAQALIKEQNNITLGDSERLLGYLEGTGKNILPEPQAIFGDTQRMPGIDGRRMSNSHHNLIPLRAEPDEVEKKIRTMPTDPARIRLADAGDPDKCPVWQFHRVYSDDATLEQVQQQCRGASWGCLECKQPIIDAIIAEQAPMRERAKPYLQDPDLVHSLVAEGSENARDAVRSTMNDIRDAMGLARR